MSAVLRLWLNFLMSNVGSRRSAEVIGGGVVDPDGGDKG